MGVIESLSAGYRLVGYRLYLLVVPVVLDLILWLAPRLSVENLFGRLAEFYTSMAQTESLSGDMVTLTQQAAALIEQAGRGSNLVHMLVSSSLLHVPSLMITLEPMADAQVYEVRNPLLMVGLFAGFALLSLLFGVLYLGMLARYLPIGQGEKGDSLGRLFYVSGRRWLLTLLYTFLVGFAFFAVYTPAILGISLIMLLIPALGSGLIFLLGGLTFVVYFYLYFAVIGFIVDDLSIFDAVMRSMRLVRHNFWSTLGFIIMLNFISIGFSLLLGSVAAQQPYGTLVAIVVNAYIGTGLAMAILVFYRTRLLRLEGHKDVIEI
ncbi:MAG: hypothetical protein H6641_09205 [Caldilineaceae bacterium]|nr:hypothetical protein [Caldilineaceae bacterium]